MSFTYTSRLKSQNVLSSKLCKVITFLTCIGKAPSSNLGRGSLPQSFQANVRIIQNRTQPPPFMSFLVYYSLLTLPFAVTDSVLLTALLNEP